MSPSVGLLNDKVAIVTGGGGGIGRGISERFATEGARVLVVDIDGARAAESAAAAGNDALGCMVDVREPGSGETIVGTALDRFGRVDILVNNVGHYGGGRKQFHE